MVNNQLKGLTHKSQGAHTSDTNLLPRSSCSSLTDVEQTQKAAHRNNFHDAHQSFASILNEQEDRERDDPQDTNESTTTTDADIYKLKLTQKKWSRYPNRLELEQLNRHLQRKYHRRFQTTQQRSRRCSQRECNFTLEQELPRSNVPSQTRQPTVQHQAEIKESYQSYQDLDQQPRRVRSKLRDMFSCFGRNSSNTCNDEAEKGVDEAENAEYYHFDHGSSTFYQTTDCPPHLLSEIISQRTTAHATKFWAEFFGSINVGVSFFITFFIQFYRFILYSILRAIIVGFLQTTSDYLLKPMLTVVFNGFLQPPLTFTQNIFQSICNMAEPLTNLMRNLLEPFTECVRAFRVVEVKNINKEQREHKASD